METLSIGELKAKFSEVLEKVKSGQEIVISYGKKREKVAVILPYAAYAGKINRILGLLKGQAGFVIHDDFKMTDDEILDS